MEKPRTSHHEHPASLGICVWEGDHRGVEEVQLHSAVPRQGHLSVFQGRETVTASESHLVLHLLVDSRWFDPEVEILDEAGEGSFVRIGPPA
jgi:hypothetical protein